MWFVALLKRLEMFTPPPFVPVVRTPTSAIVVNIEKCTATFTPINHKIMPRRPEPERRPPKLIWCRLPLRTCVMSVHWRCRQVTIRCQRVPFVICPSIIPVMVWPMVQRVPMPKVLINGRAPLALLRTMPIRPMQPHHPSVFFALKPLV